MNTKTRKEIEKRLSQLPEPTDEQLRVLAERIKKHREKHGILDHRGIFGNFIRLFR